MLKRDGWQALQEAQEGAMPRQLRFSFSPPDKAEDYDCRDQSGDLDQFVMPFLDVSHD